MVNLALNGKSIFSTDTANKTTQGLGDFLTLVREKGLAVHNRYYVEIQVPRGLINKYSMYGSTISLLCSGGEFPALNIESRNVFWQGASRPNATSVRFGDMFLFFYMEQDMTMKTFFDDWFSLIADPITGVVGYNDEYATEIRIRQLDRQNDVTYGIELVNAFPKATYPMQLTYQGGQLHRLPVSFGYRYWKNMNIEYFPNNGSSIFGDLLGGTLGQLANKVSPVIYGILR